MIDFGEHIIHHKATVRQTLEMLNKLSGDNITLFVEDDERKIIGAVTDGDVRRGLLRGVELKDEVHNLMNPNFWAVTSNNYDLETIKKVKSNKIKLLPVLDAEKKILRLIDFQQQLSFLPVDAVIMAGGEGIRLRPLTEKTPKPLLKVGDKPILEHNLDRLRKYGVCNIHITLNYLGDRIIECFGNGKSKGLNIQYVKESQKMGTLGAISLIEDFEHDVILVMNSDILTNIDFEDFYGEFMAKGADLAVASIPYEVKVPYAVLELNGQKIVSFAEKPTYTYYSNGGIYLLKKEVLQFIPNNRRYDATELMEKMIQEGLHIFSYPIRSYWLDIGKPQDYEKAQEDIHHIEL